MASPSIHAMAEGASAATEFPSTTAGLQAAIDSLAGAKGKVFIGPGTLEHTTVISIHENCHLQGSGVGVTVIKRATGSLLTGDPNYSGNSILTTKYGSNGTPPAAVANALTNITISDITLDGNAPNFGSVTIAGNNHFGVRAFWTDGLRVTNVEAKEFLQIGIGTDCCKNVHVSDVKIYHAGQYATVSSKNSLSFNNTQNSEADGYNRFYTVTNVISDSPGDEHLHFANVSDVSVSSVTCNAGERVIEFEGQTTNCTTMERFAFSGITAYNHTEEFLANSITAGVPLSHVSLIGCHGKAANSHALPCISITGTTGHTVDHYVIDGCTFENYNAADGSNVSTVLLLGTSATYSTNVSISNSTFLVGNTASTRTNCHGIEVATNIKRLSIKNCRIVSAAGVGVYVHPGASQIVQDFVIDGVVVDTSNNGGFHITENNSTSGIIRNGVLANCLSIDANRQTGSAAFYVGAASAAGGGVVQYITLSGCRAYKNSGSVPTRGVDFQDGAGGTTDNIFCVGCDFTTLTAPYNSGGAPTNIRVQVPPGLGSGITAAATITIPSDGSTFYVNGNTNITNGITVNPWDNGRSAVLIFKGTPTVSDTGTSKLAGNFVAAGTTNDYDTLTLCCDGTNWYEVARSTN